MASKLSRFLSELKRRKVYHVAGAYVVVGAVLGEVVNNFLPGLNAPEWAVSFLIVLILIGFPIALVLAWAYEVRPEEPEPGKPAGAAKPQRPTIAVLPFEDFSPNPDDAYFAGGMHEEILTQLQKIGGLAVRARTSALRYREKPKPLPEIARELGVQYILEGSARKAGDRVRLTAQLMEAEADEHIWADNYDRPLSIDNLFEVQAEIAHQVASELKAAISPDEERRFADRPTESLEAYQEYLRGKHFAHRYTKDGFQKGIERFERAVAIDESFAAAHVGLGNCYKEMADLSYMDPAEGYAKARTALEKAVELDETLGEAHANLASMRFVSEWDMSSPGPMFLRAVKLSPDNADVFQLYGTYLMLLGEEEESVSILRRGVELDPLMPMATTWLACALFYAERFDESIALHKKILELEPKWHWSHIYLSHNYSLKGDHSKALAHADEITAIAESTGDTYIVTYVGGDYAWAGEEVRARKILDDAIELHARGSIDAVSVAVIYGQLGEVDNAFEWMNRAVEEHAGLTTYLKVYRKTFLKELISDPRYDEILARIGFPD